MNASTQSSGEGHARDERQGDADGGSSINKNNSCAAAGYHMAAQPHQSVYTSSHSVALVPSGSDMSPDAAAAAAGEVEAEAEATGGEARTGLQRELSLRCEEDGEGVMAMLQQQASACVQAESSVASDTGMAATRPASSYNQQQQQEEEQQVETRKRASRVCDMRGGRGEGVPRQRPSPLKVKSFRANQREAFEAPPAKSPRTAFLRHNSCPSSHIPAFSPHGVTTTPTAGGNSNGVQPVFTSCPSSPPAAGYVHKITHVMQQCNATSQRVDGSNECDRSRPIGPATPSSPVVFTRLLSPLGRVMAHFSASPQSCGLRSSSPRSSEGPQPFLLAGGQPPAS